MSIKEIEAKAKELQELKRMREELEAEIDSLEDQIKAGMGDQEQIIAGGYKITWKAITSSRFDSSAFKKANPDLAAQFIKTSTVKRFSIA
ncbi:MAG: hypothetical protein IJ418_08245 [Clostridia bacterium]|nr:hypothetical protein [Clostridia bacterium]